MKTNISINERLIKDCIKGKREAYEKIYKLFAKEVFAECYKVLLNREEAEDMMHNTFITAFEKLHTLKDISHFKAWIKKIAVNKCYDNLRNKKAHTTGLELAKDFPDTETDIDNFDYQDLRIDEVLKAIALLPMGYRIIISLKLIEDVDFKTISKQLGISESTVRSQYYRAKEKIRQTINQNKLI